jgi:hypothetical protein
MQNYSSELIVNSVDADSANARQGNSNNAGAALRKSYQMNSVEAPCSGADTTLRCATNKSRP